jgi:hypothetical protein
VFCARQLKLITLIFTCVVSFTETTDGDSFTLFMGDEVIDFPLLFEKLLSTNDENFPAIMEFLKTNNIVPKLSDVHKELGYTVISSNCDLSNYQTKWRLIQNLIYLKENKCDLNLEMFNFLRSLTFGGKIIKRGKYFLDVIQILLPFCTDFFIDPSNWKKIRYFCGDTKEIVIALHFLITNYGREKDYKFLPSLQKYEPFSLKHLARNKVRENVWKNKKINLSFLSLCKENLPIILFQYLNFEN